MQTIGFLGVPEPTAEGERIFSDDVAGFGLRITSPGDVRHAVTFGRPVEGEA
jgi:hypothetical protein